MTDMGVIADITQALGVADLLGKEVGNMVSELKSQNGRRRSAAGGRTRAKAGANQAADADADFSGAKTSDVVANPSESNALASYKLAKDYMGELGKLQALADYRQRVETSAWLQVVEGFRIDVHERGFLKPLRRIVPEPTPGLEAILNSEITAIGEMQKHVGKAIDNWQVLINELRAYDADIMAEFGMAKSSFLSNHASASAAKKVKAGLQDVLAHTSIEAEDYAEKKIQLDNLEREERAAAYSQEEAAQKMLYTVKQSEVVQVKEQMVEKGLHVFRLVNDYFGTFLKFVQKTSAADSVVPKLAETMRLVSDCYKTLSAVLERRNAETTAAAESFASSAEGISYKVFPNAHIEAQKQKGILEKADSATNFTEQAWKFLRENGYDSAGGAGQREAAPPAA